MTTGLDDRRRKSRRAAAALGAFVAVLVLDARTATSTERSAASPPTEQSSTAVAGGPLGTSLVRMLGRHATTVLAPSSGTIGALVAVPRGKRAEDYGLDPVAPGIGRLRGQPARIEAFGFSHPELRLEVAPPLHTLLDHAGRWVRADVARRERGADGKGVLVGVADTGLDVTHPDMLDEHGMSRVAWMLDLSVPALHEHAALETRFGIPLQEGKTRGAVYSKSMIDRLLARIRDGSCVEVRGTRCAPSDEIGHGTHVTGIAASRGADGKHVGIAPAADIVFVRISQGANDPIENDDLVRAVEFMFDRADAEKRPMVVNLSLGSDFGPHDGTTLWEQAIASHVGPDHPGRAIVAAAGNSGSVAESPIHQSVHIAGNARTRVPIRTVGALTEGSVQVWVTFRDGADVKIGLEGPAGDWIAPVARGHQNGKNTDQYKAGVIYTSETGAIPEASDSAVVVWAGAWPAGTYHVTFEGSGTADLYVQGALEGAGASFTNGVREGTINLPATHPSIIGVGCTVNRPSWRSISGLELAVSGAPTLDEAGGLAENPVRVREVTDGEVCWFSSAGPNAKGVPKPEISAPGLMVSSALSRSAKPGSASSAFSSSECPQTPKGTDGRCRQVDATHAVTGGTSMSAPVVAGVVALLLQRDPTLSQDKIVALLQAGAHSFRGPSPFEGQAGPGEVDARGALDALEQMQGPVLHLPSREQSWITLSSEYVAADGSTPITAIVELRTADAEHRADFFDQNRIAPVLLVDGEAAAPPEIVRRGPGVWFYVWRPPAGLGGSRATFGATFDGQPIVSPRTVPIATDGWNARYPSHATGQGCAIGAEDTLGTAGGTGLIAAAVVLRLVFRRRRRG